MVVVKTSKGKTFQTDWMWGPTTIGKNLMVQLVDERSMYEIIADFEGCVSFETHDDTTGLDETFKGYTEIESVGRSTRAADGVAVVQIALRKPEE